MKEEEEKDTSLARDPTAHSPLSNSNASQSRWNAIVQWKFVYYSNNNPLPLLLASFLFPLFFSS